MNQILPFLPYILSAVIPPIAAILNDPAPRRRWLRVLVVVVLTLASAALNLAQSGEPFTVIAFVKTTAAIGGGSQLVHRLFGHALGKVEAATGPGLGALVDGLLRFRVPKAESGMVGAVDGLGKFTAAKTRLDAYLAAGAITKEQYDGAFSLAQQELVAGTGNGGGA
ncbi:hypothetical protein [Armatimonas sp.]|uniref:hypothetical protein n=1 Tax=Armatimonas sp. TaxID=1872638 RepID=UPI003753D05E